MLHRLFGGRITRLVYAKAILLSMIAPIGLIAVIVTKDMLDYGEFYPFITLLLFSITIISQIFQYSVFVKRLHDFNMPGWWVLIPYANALFYLGAFFVPGNERENTYGKPPTNNAFWDEIYPTTIDSIYK